MAIPNARDPAGQSTYCHQCGTRLIEQDWYRLGRCRVTNDGRCAACAAQLPGVFGRPAG